MNRERERERVNDSESFCGISAIRREICLFSFCHIMLNQYIFRVFDVIFIVGLQFSLWKLRVLRLTLKTCLDICVNVFVLFAIQFFSSFFSISIITLPIPFATTILRRHHHHSTRMCSCYSKICRTLSNWNRMKDRKKKKEKKDNALFVQKSG